MGSFGRPGAVEIPRGINREVVVIRGRPNVGPIGLDLGSRAIRMVQVAFPGGHPEICASAEFVYPAETAEARARDSRARSAVRQMLSSGGFVGRNVVMARSDEEAQLKSLRLPNMPQEELPEVVCYEAAERFVFDDTEAESVTSRSERADAW